MNSQTAGQQDTYPCCSHCHDHSAPWFGSETLTKDGAGHTEPCQNCHPDIADGSE